MSVSLRDGDTIWIKAKVKAYRPDTKKVWATVIGHMGSTNDNWFEEGQYALFSEETIEGIIKESQLYLLASNRKSEYSNILPDKEAKELSSALIGKCGAVKECNHEFKKASETSINGDYICSKCGKVEKQMQFKAAPTFSGRGKMNDYRTVQFNFTDKLREMVAINPKRQTIKYAEEFGREEFTITIERGKKRNLCDTCLMVCKNNPKWLKRDVVTTCEGYLSTEQKEYCTCKDSGHYYKNGTITCNVCDKSQGKPIPAEKKKCKHRWGITKELPFRFKCATCGEEKEIPPPQT